MKLSHIFSSVLVSKNDGYVIDYYGDALVNNIVGNFAQDTFFAANGFNNAIQNAMSNSQGMGSTTHF